MRSSKALLVIAPMTALSLIDARDASACGGCFVQQTENTQVTGHKMILSVGKTQTTLWDQISYSGAPDSFAWILPTKGQVDIGLSSDALFQTLESSTQVTVASPSLQCNPPPNCGGFGSVSATTGAGGDGGVVVVAEEVVGPYETVQLKASDPNALKTWLLSHSYNIPADVSPIIDAYVSEGFDFLALKLVPGQTIQAMRPVRVTTPGASPVLPLRMVAAGTGPVTPITLWVMGEGRYEPANFPSFVITQDQVVWNWDTQSSNLSVVKKAGFDASDGKAWLIEAGEPMSKYGLTNQLVWLAQNDPAGSGYADEMGMGAEQAAMEDMDALFASIADTALWVTRLHGELSRAALATDLEVSASADQATISRYLQATATVGTPPACPTFPPCDDGSTGSGGSGGAGGSPDGGWDFWGKPDKPGGGSGGCAMTPGAGISTAISALALTTALALARRRRSRR